MEKGGVMTRKDSEKDAERPHYYSQFWLDIAAGRRVIGGPKPEDGETTEVEIPEPAPLRKPGRAAETRASAVAETEMEEEIEQEDTVEESDLPNIVFDDEPEVATEEDYSEGDAEEEEDFFEEDEEEEEEEDEEWGRRGGARKKAKPVRPTKPVKKTKREPRRNF